ncbi:WD40/YVTN/BNR-like repeat-containing protein [Variovorax sp. LARHSF232]
MTAKRPARGGRLFAALLATGAAAWAVQAASDSQAWRDVLDTPAIQSPLASRALLNGIARAGSTRLVAVGQRGHIVYSDDAGRRWLQAEVPISSDLVALSFPDATNGWAVGHDGVVLRTKDGGKRWTVQPIEAADRPQSPGAENPFLDVWFRDASNGYVVGAFGLVLQTQDGGANWQPLMHATDNPKSLHLYAVRGFGPDVYIAGEQGLMLKLAQGDTRFRALELPYKGTLFGITGSAQSLVAYGLRGTVLRSSDGGRNWLPTPTGLQVGLTAGTRQDDGRIVLVSQAGHVLVSNDDGASFKVAKTERTVPAAAVAASSQGTLVLAGPRGAQALQLP